MVLEWAKEEGRATEHPKERERPQTFILINSLVIRMIFMAYFSIAAQFDWFQLENVQPWQIHRQRN